MKRLWTTFLTLSPLAQIGLVLGPLVVMALVSGGVGGCVSKIKDRRFDAAIQKERAERDKFKQKADEAEERAKAAEADKARYQAAFEIAGTKAQAAMDKVQDAENKFNQEVADISNPVDPCERLKRIRAKLGLPETACTTEENPD
jgi:outer membrane murein-binding lipoprotein Lpp